MREEKRKGEKEKGDRIEGEKGRGDRDRRGGEEDTFSSESRLPNPYKS